MKLEISLNVAKYSFGQISPINKLHETIGIQVKRIKNQDGVRNVLDLESLNNHPHLEDIYVNLGNKSVFKHLITYLKNLDILYSINGLNLSNNNIKYLSGFRTMERTRFQMLNFKENDIQTTQQLNFLTCIQFTEIYLAGNPVCDRKDFVSFMKKTFPNIEKSDIETDRVVSFKNSNLFSKNLSARSSDALSTNSFGVSVDSYSGMQKYRASNDWHQITVVHNGGYKKEEIAEQFFSFFASQEISNDFYLCYYKEGSSEDTFLVRKCFEHLELLMKNELKLIHFESLEEIQLKIIMNFAPYESDQVDPEKLILEVASSKSYNLMERSLNLENFNGKPDMKNLYIDFSDPKVYSSILQQCGRKFLSQIVEVRLGHNNISNCKGLKALNTMRSLKILCLNNNRIKSFDDLSPISHITLKEIKLDGNPLCKKYDSATKYIRDALQLNPHLTALDGVPIENSSNILSYRKNFLCTINAYDFTEQFVGIYFRIYDSDKRSNLSEMYHEKAIFTICFTYNPRRYEDERRFDIYKSYDRNLHISSSHTKNVIYNVQNITKVFEDLPKTEHDLFSFTSDTTICNEKMVVITLTGVFKDIPKDNAFEPEILMGFSRTFTLCPTGPKVNIFKGTVEYEIINDQLTIFNPTENHFKNSFKFVPPKIDLTCTASDENEKKAYIIMFQKLAKLKEVWATKYLEEGKWDFENALKYFVEKLENGGVPKEAFLEDSS
ncbi:nuclear RNA export factor 2 isoform X2 [Condylostylus longicornis]|nr:nuclear RNA export factor 2 isoform X2 [Condylostylus longicornis]